MSKHRCASYLCDSTYGLDKSRWCAFHYAWPDCRRLRPGACCDQAEQTNCVCMYSYRCPTHGQTHIGTHD